MTTLKIFGIHLILLSFFFQTSKSECPFASSSDQPPIDHHHLRVLRESAEDGQQTFEGCECKTECGASLSDEYACDWCRTNDGCGHSSIAGSWDYCKYDAIDKSYYEKSFTEKMDILWKEIVKNTSRLPEYPNPATAINESVRTTFDNERDVMPQGRTKVIHSVGVICPFKISNSKSSTYTGLFAPGEDVVGLVRMGSAADPVSNKGITPGLGIKFPRTGYKSGNVVALYSLSLGQSWDFFAYNMSNHISAPSDFVTKILAKKFMQASQCAPQVGVSDMAKVKQDGTLERNVSFPFKLFLVPGVTTPVKEKTVDEINEELEAFEVGTSLFTVYACGSSASDAEFTPTDGGLDVACSDHIRLGDMITTDKCTTSKFGDERFFIQHQRIEDDWKLRPDFLSSYDAAKACGWSGTITADGAPPKCSK